jgi:hypothetical protein
MPAQRTWARLRLKADVATDDPAWVTNQVDPDSFEMVVGGTPTNGNYTMTLTPEDGSGAIANTFNRAAAEDNTGIATGLTAVIAARIAGSGILSPYLRASTSAVAIIQTLVRIDDLPGPRRFQITTSAPGPGTLTFGPDDIFPITRRFAMFQTPPGPVSNMEISFVPTAAGNPVPNNAGLQFDVEVVERIDRAAALDDPALAVGVTRSSTATAHSVEEKIVIPNNGSEGLGVRIFNITGPPTPSFDAIEVLIRAGRS